MSTHQEIDERLKNINLQKTTLKQLSEEYGISVRTLQRYMRRLNIRPKKRTYQNFPRDNLGRFFPKNSKMSGDKFERQVSNQSHQKEYIIDKSNGNSKTTKNSKELLRRYMGNLFDKNI
jgi:hypothetical protein